MDDQNRNSDSTMGYFPKDPSQETEYLNPQKPNPAQPEISHYEPDLVRIEAGTNDHPQPNIQGHDPQRHTTQLKEEHIPRCRRCHYPLLGMPQAKGTCPSCGKLFDLERPRTYTTYADHRSSLLIAAHTCGTIPLVMSLLTLIGYVFSHGQPLITLNLLFGGAIFASSCLLQLIYLIQTSIPFKFKARRTVFCLLLALCNFPLWYLSVKIAY